MKNQNTYGVQGLLMAGIAANESNWGKSSISQKKNNLFGLNATDAAPGENASQYSSVEAVSYTHLDVYKRQIYCCFTDQIH